MRDIVDKVFFLKGIFNIDGKLITYFHQGDFKVH